MNAATETESATPTVSDAQLIANLVDAVTPSIYAVNAMSAKGYSLFSDACDMAERAFTIYEVDRAAFRDLANYTISLIKVARAS